MENDFTSSLALSKAPAWTHPYALPHPCHVMSNMIATILRGTVKLATFLSDGRECVINFSDSGQPSLIWLDVRIKIAGYDDDLSGYMTEALSRKASEFNHDNKRGARLFRGIVFDRTRRGELFLMVSLAEFSSPVYLLPMVTRNALASVQDVPGWHGVAASEGARVTAGEMPRALRRSIDDRLALYQSCLTRSDMACLTLADLFGLQHPLSEDILSSQEAYEAVLSENPDLAPNMNVDIPETISLQVKGQALL